VPKNTVKVLYISSLDKCWDYCYTDFVSKMLTNTDKETDMRSKFTKTGYNTVTHTYACPWTDEVRSERYWVPLSGGYVYVDSSRDGNNSGTLGTQPTYTGGSTWRSHPDDLMALVKREWRAFQREWRRAMNPR